MPIKESTLNPSYMQKWLADRQKKKESELQDIFRNSEKSVHERLNKIKQVYKIIWDSMYNEFYHPSYLHDDVGLKNIVNAVDSHIQNKIKIIDSKPAIIINSEITFVGNDVDMYDDYFRNSKKNFKIIVQQITDELKKIADLAVSKNENGDSSESKTISEPTFIVEKVF